MSVPHKEWHPIVFLIAAVTAYVLGSVMTHNNVPLYIMLIVGGCIGLSAYYFASWLEDR